MHGIQPPRKKTTTIGGASAAGCRTKTWAGWLGLLAILVCSNGCTVVFAVAGATIDTLVVSSPIWGPSAVNYTKLRNVQQDGKPGDPEPPEGQAMAMARAGGETPEVLVRLVEGPAVRQTPDKGYYSWVAMIPLVPYANSHVDLFARNGTPLPESYEGRMGNKSQTVRFPLERLPASVRPSNEGEMADEFREAAVEIAKGELASLEPSTFDYAVALSDSLNDQFQFRLSACAQKTLARELAPVRVQLDQPESTGWFRYDPCGRMRIAVEARKEDITIHGDEVEVRLACREATYLGLKVEGDQCVATMPPSTCWLVARTRGYREPAPAQIVLTGQVQSYRLEVSSLSYGVTTIGANLLSLFGLPTSTARLVLDMNLQARRGSDPTPILERAVTIKTRHRTVAVYYGGGYAKELTAELQQQLEDQLTAFAGQLRPLLQVQGKVALAQSE